MAKLKLAQKNIQELEGIADFAYNTLRNAVETETPGALYSAQSLYGGMGNYLSGLIEPTRHPDLLNKGGKRAEKIEKFILQWVLMFNPSPEKSSRYKIKITEDQNDGMGGLKAYIDTKDKRDSPQGEVFRLTAHKATELRNNGRYNLILNALDYVRKKYLSSHKNI